ncbi:hypothetical protein JNUCC64_06230 [Streptomyces sp. JNUCC 64]
MDEYCAGPARSGTTGTGATADAEERTAPDGPPVPFAECVLCREPTEYPETHKGITLCPRCEWLEAQRSACSG